MNNREALTTDVIGTVTILSDMEYTQHYETAAWHKTYKIAAGQTVELIATPYDGAYRFYANVG